MHNEFSLARFMAAGGARSAMLIGDSFFDLEEAAKVAKTGGLESAEIGALLASWDEAFPQLERLAAALGKLDDAKRDGLALKSDLPLTTPIPRPGKVLCAAANYAAHVAEMAKTGFTGPSGAQTNAPTRPEAPYHFLKATSCTTGPFDDIVIPGPDHRIDWEVELGAVIGRPAKNVPAERALDHVAGYVVVNDVSCRAATWRKDRPNIRSDWLAGKSYDTFLPLGPLFRPAAFAGDYRALQLQLWVNGELKQDGTASDMIFSLEEQVAYLSAMLTLESGDVIATGTPAGVGQGAGAYLAAGDLVEAEIAGMGRQRNRVVLPA